MNAMQILVSQPWVERLGMMLLHFLWQGLFIAILYAAARRSVARTSSLQTRYLLACGALAAMMAAPLVTWELMAPSDASPEAIYRIRSTPQAASSTGIATTTTLPDSVRAAVSSAPSERFLFWVVMRRRRPSPTCRRLGKYSNPSREPRGTARGGFRIRSQNPVVIPTAARTCCGPSGAA